MRKQKHYFYNIIVMKNDGSTRFYDGVVNADQHATPAQALQYAKQHCIDQATPSLKDDETILDAQAVVFNFIESTMTRGDSGRFMHKFRQLFGKSDDS